MAKRKRGAKTHSHTKTAKPAPKEPSPLPALPSLPELPSFKLNSWGPTVNVAPDNNENAEDDNEGFEEVRRVKKQKIKDVSNAPGFYLSPLRLKCKVKVSALRELALWIVGEGVAPQWLLVKGKPEIKRAVVCMVPGFTGDMFDGQRDTKLHIKNGNTTATEPEEDFGAPIQRNEDGDAIVNNSAPEEKKDDTPFDFTSSKKRRRQEHSDYYPHKLDQTNIATCMKDLADIFPYAWPTVLDGDEKMRLPSPIGSFLRTPLDKEQRKAIQKKHKKTRVTLESLLMTTEDFLDSDYPLHSETVKAICKKSGIPVEQSTAKSKAGEDGWVETDMEKKATNGRKVLAIDCEMCITEGGKELTRISVVDLNGKCIYDTLVKPELPITDYLTRFSGITAAKMESVTTTLADVQKHLLDICDSETILVGHSLDSDLTALKLCHPHIIDTTLLYEHPRGKPYKSSLKYLADKILNKEIQKGGAAGHDSIEDALTCIELLKVKLEREPGFGSQMQKDESLFVRIARQGKKGALVDWGNAAFHSQGAQITAGCANDEEVVENVRKIMNPSDAKDLPDILWTRLRSLEFARGWQSNRDDAGEPKIVTTQAVIDATASVTKNLKAIYESLPIGTAFIVYSGIGDPRQQAHYNAMHRQYKTEFKVRKWDDLTIKWTDVEEQALAEGIRMGRDGLSFLTVKTEKEEEAEN
ncbi:hypothetical protein BJ508DRAFT_414036 [Ascobolus immersus RN42]|uniref:Exonuclease domain-containing protein n=1 Tax=Ascobolus immersus RN42 TaxID=1160509 RepID=A0A3N4IAZ5_ASCIM|nr:hypothetical protein BJ508DRAFT_414036 [Ascobolus immersus RN42]